MKIKRFYERQKFNQKMKSFLPRSKYIFKKKIDVLPIGKGLIKKHRGFDERQKFNQEKIKILLKGKGLAKKI